MTSLGQCKMIHAVESTVLLKEGASNEWDSVRTDLAVSAGSLSSGYPGVEDHGVMLDATVGDTCAPRAVVASVYVAGSGLAEAM